ncbi:MAG TPA: aldehyde dehydrogenase family protein, partial [Acidimicrobiales bacterium]|nr:aldehyde dehydrogenase family protein [Acidimicrobiales bacterium]
MTIATVNPTTGRTEATFEALDDAAVEARVSAAAEASRRWRTSSFAERARLMTGAADLLDGEAP